jgi:hypothetical protein
VWVGLFSIGTLAGFLLLWLGFAAVPVIVFLVVVIAVAPGAKSRAGGGLVGLGVGIGTLAVYAGASCRPYTRIVGGWETCEGPDLSIYLLAAVALLTLGVVATVRQFRREQGP